MSIVWQHPEFSLQLESVKISTLNMNILNLPNEILELIFEKLPRGELMLYPELPLVCKHFQSIFQLLRRKLKVQRIVAREGGEFNARQVSIVSLSTKEEPEIADKLHGFLQTGTPLPVHEVKHAFHLKYCHLGYCFNQLPFPVATLTASNLSSLTLRHDALTFRDPNDMLAVLQSCPLLVQLRMSTLSQPLPIGLLSKYNKNLRLFHATCSIMDWRPHWQPEVNQDGDILSKLEDLALEEFSDFLNAFGRKEDYVPAVDISVKEQWPIWHSLSNLKKLKLASINYIASLPKFADHIADSCPLLEELSLTSMPAIGVEGTNKDGKADIEKSAKDRKSKKVWTRLKRLELLFGDRQEKEGNRPVRAFFGLNLATLYILDKAPALEDLTFSGPQLENDRILEESLRASQDNDPDLVQDIQKTLINVTIGDSFCICYRKENVNRRHVTEALSKALLQYDINKNDYIRRFMLAKIE